MSTPLVPAGLLDHLLWPLRALTHQPAQLQRLVSRLGLVAPMTAADVGALGFVSELIEAVDAVTLAARRLRSAGSSVAADAAAVVEAVQAVEEAVRALADADPDGFFDRDMLATLAAELPGLILAEALAASGPPAAALRLLDVLQRERIAAGPGTQPAYRHRLALDQLPGAVLDPAGRIADRWGWRTGAVRGDQIVADLVDITRLLTMRSHRTAIPDIAADLVRANARWTRRAATLPLFRELTEGETRLVEAGVVVSPAGDGDGRDDGVFVGLLTDYPPPAAISISPRWSLEVAPPIEYGVLVTPDSVTPHGGSGGVGSLTLRSTAETTLDLPLATAVVPELLITVTVDTDELELRIAADQPLQLLIDPTFGSAFLADLVGGPISVDLPLDLSWTQDGGLRLGGGLGLSVTIPIGRQLGPIMLDELTLGLTAGDTDGTIRIAATVVASAVLGPLVLAVDGLGVALDIAFGDTLLPDLGVDVVPPAGIGIGLTLPEIASGGGYLFIDPDGTSYAGVLDLDLLKFGISAVGLVETDSPDVDGWSVFLALFLDLSIPLGFGFTLNGVGGLVGFNRRLDTDALEAAVLGGTLGAALFPENPIAAAPQIVDTFRSMFPAEQGSTVFGPVVAIGWGAPTLVEAEVGVVISLPDPIVIAVIGSVSIVLPHPDAPLVSINMDAGGVIDLGAGTIEVFAALHDSTVLGFALSGGMAMRASFTGEPLFLFSLGGFHPGFTPPPEFPALDRLALAVDGGDLLQIRFECYFALTSNTVQFGAALSLSATVEGFGIEGGVDFDALIELSPFSLRTHVGFHISVVAAGVDLMGVWFSGTLEGPNPWHVDGRASFKVLGIETSIQLDEIIGSKRPEPAPPPAELLEALRIALADEAAWYAVASPVRGVVLAAEVADGLTLEPDGELQVSQRVVPLELDLTHAGESPIGAYDRFELIPGTGLESTGTVRDWFAPAAFLDVAPTEALAAPSFEQLAAGLIFGGASATAGPGREVSRDYKQILRDPELGTPDQAGTFDLLADPRVELTVSMLPAEATLTVVADGAAPTLDKTRTSLVNRQSGVVIATRGSWSAAHQSELAADQSVILTPSWEVLT